MDSLGSNPLGILTFIVAPAILTNASSIMALGTSNRFARAIDRTRALSAEVTNRKGEPNAEMEFRIRQLRNSEKRVLILVRALTSFYLSVGCFGAASLASLFGAISVVMQLPVMQQISLSTALVAGVAGVASLVCGSALLVWETRIALRILADEIQFLHKELTK